MIQKYDETQLFKSFKKIAGNYISELQSEIGAWLKSQDKYIQTHFFASMPNFMKDIEYRGYSIHRNKYIGIAVYYFDSGYEDITSAQQKIISIITNKNMPFKFTIYIDPETEGVIELCIDIEDLVKLDNVTSKKKSISYLDACDIIERILADNRHSIQSDLNRVIGKYNIRDICKIDTEFGVGHYTSHGDYEKYIDISLIIFDYNLYAIRDTNSKEFIRLIEKVLREIESIMKRYIKFKFSADTDLETIGISVEYESVKNHKDALSFIRESTSIFDSIEFL